jgi:hypothetical protein
MRWVIVTAMLALSAQASADPAGADAEVKLAEEAAAKGDFVGAASHYKLAHAADARPELICNAGVAYYKAKDATRAHLYLSRCQERGTALDADFVSAVRAALAAVEAMLRGGAFTPVDVVVKPEGATVTIGALGPTDAFVGSRLVWLPHGRHTLTVKAEGYVDKVEDINAQAADRLPVSVTLDKVAVVNTDVKLPRPDETPQPIVETPEGRPSKVSAYVAIGGTVLALVVAGIAHSQMRDEEELTRNGLTNEQRMDHAESASSWNTVRYVTGGIGIAGAAASAFLILRW